MTKEHLIGPLPALAERLPVADTQQRGVALRAGVFFGFVFRAPKTKKSLKAPKARVNERNMVGFLLAAYSIRAHI